jgi:hypothetical protein
MFSISVATVPMAQSNEKMTVQHTSSHWAEVASQRHAPVPNCARDYELLSPENCNSDTRCEDCSKATDRLFEAGTTRANADFWMGHLRRSDKIRKCSRALLGQAAYKASVDWILAWAEHDASLNQTHNILRDCRKQELYEATRGICK